jgi:hypothetical protein
VSGTRFLRAAVGARAALAGVALSLLAGSASAEEITRDRFASIMDSVFGHGAWRMTGGYRSPQREDELRAQGAMTVRPGGLSRHSLGSPDAPGAYDLVVDGLSPYEAADRLRSAGAPFARYQPKGAHGTQGPHLHLEPDGFGSAPGFRMASTGKAKAPADDGPARAVTLVLPAPSARDAAAVRQELARLREGALQARAEAQLELGRAYALGFIVPRDFAIAQSWLDAAAANPNAGLETRAAATAELAEVTALLEVERAQQPARYARLKTSPADR